MNQGRLVRRRLVEGGTGITFVEFIVALAMAAAFLGGVLAAFSQIIKASNQAQIRMDATNSGRAALEMMARDIKMARFDWSYFQYYFLGINNHLSYGDGIDNDNDGQIDEEYADAVDNDYDWVSGRDDNHSFVNGYYERQRLVGLPDLGDFLVDEDCRFDQDYLRFAIDLIYINSEIPLGRAVTYQIGEFEGEKNVLMRTVTYYGWGPTREEIAPLAFNVLSLNFLYWTANGTQPYWVEAWDASQYSSFAPPGLELPASVYIQISLYAGDLPIEQYRPGEPVEVTTLSTVADIETIINDVRYR